MTKDKAADCVAQAIDMVLAHPNHAQFLIRKLWAEFIASPIPQATLDALATAYRTSGYQLKPVIRGILTHPLIFESLDEPNLIKPPIVYLVGVLRAMGVPMKGNYMTGAMTNMQQRPYRPPNVAGWEGGISWLNTNTVQGRFDLIVRAQYLLYSNGHGELPPRRARRHRQEGRVARGRLRTRVRVGQPPVAVGRTPARRSWISHAR